MQSSDLVVFSALSNGRRSNTVLTSGSPENVFRKIKSSERIAGITLAVKTHWGLKNTDNYALQDPETYHDKPTLSPDDYVVKWESAQRMANDDSTLKTELASKDLFGSADLDADITAGDSTFDVVVKHADLLPGGTHDIFQDGYACRICSHSTAVATDGAEEDFTISGTPTYSGLVVTITRSGTFTNSYTVASGARVSSMIQPTADIEPTKTTPVATTAGDGDVDDTTYPIELDNYGTVEQDWTLTFTDATHYTLSGDTLGTLSSGVIGTEFTETNSDVSRPYFTIPVGFFTGTWAAGDTLTFTTHPATIPIGQLLVVPAGSASLANNVCTTVLGGEAAG
ncbi:hypothetical protein [Desulforhopalus singaporensis]|uniref:Uncharacterized protein n=1 Tax=Desulforhopalus singaporensis TaxID=91360 RepID=A0A1H0UUA8_9BACT|nr:hypothetical protein [Desulforhopalus singaporensis]SDP69792.1 hypothetical protein SAMN05660330_03724 [Desulforhopalus singaporensis]